MNNDNTLKFESGTKLERQWGGCVCVYSHIHVAFHSFHSCWISFEIVLISTEICRA